MPPLRLDPDAAAAIQPLTRAAYRRYVLAFAQWLHSNGLSPEQADEWDDLLVEWKNMMSVSKSAFGGAVASIEYFFPCFRGHLPWCHLVLKGMSIQHVPRHTVPMLGKYACFFASHFAALGMARLGAGIVVQQAKGLRPSELLNLEAADVVLPEETMFDVARNTVVNLGARVGTKAKRSQAVVIPGSHVATELLRRIKGLCQGPRDRLFPYTLARYNASIKKIAKSQAWRM